MTSVLTILVVTLWPGTAPNSANFVPFRRHGAAWSCLLSDCSGARESAAFLITDVIGNIVVFLPLGLTLAALVTGSWWRRLWISSAAGGLLSLFIETLQFRMETRATDVDDLIFNTLGTAIGAGLVLVGKRLRRTAGSAPGRNGGSVGEST